MPVHLNQAQIEAHLNSAVRAQISSIEIYNTLDSTSAELLRRSDYHEPAVCLADQQTAGRGRRGRTWHSPAGANLYCSLAWQFSQTPAQLSGLSALTAIATAEALQCLGVNCGLKWPNDVLWPASSTGHKLAGILLESSMQKGTTLIVAGIGLNVAMPKNSPIGQAWIDLQQILQQIPERNFLVAGLLNVLVPWYQQVAADDWPDLARLWDQYDVYKDQQVQLLSTQKTLTGRALGIDQQGALRLANKNGQQTIHHGELSLRLL